jgi:antitoxin component YwqK of YwqJK toxin-antitoxin module
MEQKKELNLINLFNAKGEKHGYWEDYWDDGKLMYKGNYVAGKLHGLWERYYSNGKLMYKGDYVAGNKHGYWEIYWTNGDLTHKCFYDQGKEVDYNPDEVTELTMDEIATKFGISIKQLKIKK